VFQFVICDYDTVYWYYLPFCHYKQIVIILSWFVCTVYIHWIIALWVFMTSSSIVRLSTPANHQNHHISCGIRILSLPDPDECPLTVPHPHPCLCRVISVSVRLGVESILSHIILQVVYLSILHSIQAFVIFYRFFPCEYLIACHVVWLWCRNND